MHRSEHDRGASMETPDVVAADPDAGVPVITPIPADTKPGRDLGFGGRVAGYSRKRLLNRDGTFNVVRIGRSIWQSLSPYHALLTLGWGRFLALLVAFYLAANTVFALAYVAVGATALAGPGFPSLPPAIGAFLRAYFFSVQTFATIGYGHVSPASVPANIIVTVESILGLLGIALVTGFVFARVSRPTASIVYSKRAVVAPFRDGWAFMFRCANERNNQLIEVRVRVTYSWIDVQDGRRVRQFVTLPLEYDRVTFLPLSWTIVHPIDDSSPLRTCTPDDLVEHEAEFLVLVSAVDDTSSQHVHSRTSYRAEEIAWNARFQQMFVESENEGVTGMDLRRLHAVEFLESPASSHGRGR